MSEGSPSRSAESHGLLEGFFNLNLGITSSKLTLTASGPALRLSERLVSSLELASSAGSILLGHFATTAPQTTRHVAGHLCADGLGALATS